jgi:hypothetical protein
MAEIPGSRIAPSVTQKNGKVYCRCVLLLSMMCLIKAIVARVMAVFI